MQKPNQPACWAITWSLPVLLALVLGAPLLSPPVLNPLTVLLAAACATAILGVIALTGPARPATPALSRSITLFATLAFWLTIRAALAANPAVSFIGAISQHSGAALWLLCAAWFFLASVLSTRRSLRTMLGVTSVAGGIAGTLTVLEALTSGARAWGSAAGPFENSASLGAFLAIGALACAAWGLSTRSTIVRVAAAASALICVAGIVAADSRSGAVGLLSGLAVAALCHIAATGKRARPMIALALPTFALVATLLLTAIASGLLPGPLADALGSLGNNRDVIWRSAAAQIASSPVVGVGPEQFSAWVQWSFDGTDLEFNGTHDPHNVLLGVALGGGLVAIALWAAAAIALLSALLETYLRVGRPGALAFVIALPAAFVASGLFAWASPAAALTASALCGAMLGAGASAEEHTACNGPASGAGAGAGLGTAAQARTRLPSALPFLATIAVGLVCGGAALKAIGPESEFARFDALDPQAYASLYARFPDPAYAAAAITAALSQESDPSSVRALLGDSDEQARWHVDLALGELFLAALADDEDPSAWPAFEAAVDRGKHADPASGLWDTLGAAHADRVGRSAERNAYARDALTHELPPTAREYLAGIAR